MIRISRIGELFFTSTGRLLITVTTFLCLFSIFYLLAHFNFRQALTLSFSFTLLVNNKHPLRPRPRQFEPFRVSFWPDLVAMLIAVGLVKDSDQWKAALKSRKEIPFGREDVEASRFFSCTTLSVESSGMKRLLCWWPWNWYSSDYQMSFGLCSVSYPAKPMCGERGYLKSVHSPSFFIGNYSRQGGLFLLGFGLIVDGEWWANQKQSVPGLVTNLIAEVGDRDDVKLIFGNLPFHEIVWPSDDLHYINRPVRQAVLLDREREQTLTREGWQQEEFGFYKHKFMTVRL